MSNYRRHLELGGVYFFTVNLEDRSSDAIIRHVDKLQDAWRYVKDQHPFETIAASFMPDTCISSGIFHPAMPTILRASGC